MFNFVDLNNNIEIKYEQIGNVPTYNIYTKKKRGKINGSKRYSGKSRYY